MLAGLLLLAAAPLPADPATGPAWAPIPARADAAEVAPSSYRVRPGDTLSDVVARTGAGADAIARANRLAAPFVLRPGQLLSVPPGRYHRVRRGETGIAIAQAYRVDWSAVATLNHLRPPYQLRAGERLLLPAAPRDRPPTLEERAARFRVDLDDLVTGSAPALGRRQQPLVAKAAPRGPAPPGKPVASPPATFAWPVRGRVLRRFGAMPEGGRNDGIDIAAAPGEPVAAAASGTVAWAGAYPAFGQVVLVTHGGGEVTIYARVGRPVVKRGQAVAQGQRLAAAAGPLHFEVRAGRRPVDPLSLLAPPSRPPAKDQRRANSPRSIASPTAL